MEAKKMEKDTPKIVEGNKYTVEAKSKSKKSYGQLVRELILYEVNRN